MQKLSITKVSAVVTLDTGSGQLSLNIAPGKTPKTIEEAAEIMKAKFLETVSMALGASFVDQSKELAEQHKKIMELSVELDEAKKVKPAKAEKPKKSLY